MHSGGLELTKLTYTRLEDNLIRHRGDRLDITVQGEGEVGNKEEKSATSRSKEGNAKRREWKHIDTAVLK